jgi:hypothetical protein
VATQVDFVAGFADHLSVAHDHAANRVFPGGFAFAFTGKGDCRFIQRALVALQGMCGPLCLMPR